MASGISSRFQLLSQSPGQVSHVLRTRSPLGLPEQAPWTSFDLHVLSTPPAFILSQDQTLQQNRGRGVRPPRWPDDRQRSSASRSAAGGMNPWWCCVLAVWPTRTYTSSSTGIRVAAGWVAGSRIDRQSDPAGPEADLELPALAFCLLFRFQGAEALARTVTRSDAPDRALVPTPCGWPRPSLSDSLR